MRSQAKAPSAGPIDAGADTGRGLALGLGTLLVALLCALIGASSASAFTSYVNSGSFGNEGFEPGQFNRPGQVAVDGSTGNVLVVDSGNGRVQVFGPGGAASSFLTQFGGGDFVEPKGIAIDQSTGAVYVGDAGKEKIFRYLSDGQPTPTYTLDPSYTSPPVGTGPGELGSFGGAMAVDPTNGDLLVGENYSRVVRFEAGGGSSSFTGTDAPSAGFHEILGIAVTGDGTVYVVDWEPFLEGVLDEFAPDGTATGSPPAIFKPHAVAYDPHAGNVTVVGNEGLFSLPNLTAVHNDAVVASTDFPQSANGSMATGLAVDGGGSGRVYAATEPLLGEGTVGVQVFDPVIHPDVVLDPATGVTARAAHLSGSVDPDGVEAFYRFEYSLDGGTNWTSTPEASVGNGTDPVAVEATLTGLRPNSEYRVRLAAANGNPPDSITALGSFKTAASSPDVVTGLATDRTPTGATLQGSIAAYGNAATYHFEYGLGTDYGSRMPLNYEGAGGNAFAPFAVAQPITGLQPGATYHYRLVAINAIGQSEGADRTFTTPASAVTARAYEMVSPLDKNGGHIETGYNFQTSLNGDRLIYGAHSLLPSGEALPYAPKYFGERSADGWSYRPIDPPQEAQSEQRFYDTLAASRDNSKALVLSRKALAPGASAGDSNIYLRDTATGAYTTIGVSPGPELAAATGYVVTNNPLFVAGTADFSHVVISAPPLGGCCSLLPGAPPGSLYEWDGRELRLASVQPDGTPFPGPSAPGGLSEHELSRISADGSKVWFIGSDGALYVRIDGKETRAISVSRRAGDPDTPVQAQIGGLSRDGNVVYFVSHDLTEDSESFVSTLYRYVLSTDELSVVSPNVERVFQASNDGEYVYFASRVDLGDGGSSGVDNVYAWHDGQLHRVATNEFSREVQITSYFASPNGRYLAVATYTSQTDYDNASPACTGEYAGATPSCREVYLYSADEDKLVCASCRPDGKRATGDARISVDSKVEFSHHFPQAVTDDGRVFFDTTDPLTRGDINSARDVYEFDGDQQTLISAGKSEGDSQLADVSASGNDVFFTTQDRLVGIDTDSLTDVYDARVGGGIASQNATQPQGECGGDNCRETVASPPPPPAAGSEGTSGRGNASARKHKRCAKTRHGKTEAAKKARCAKPHGKQQRAKGNRRQGR